MSGDADAAGFDLTLPDRELLFDDFDLIVAHARRGGGGVCRRSLRPDLVVVPPALTSPFASIDSTRDACSSGALTETMVPPRPMCSA